jgi:aspartate dehydrogenase
MSARPLRVGYIGLGAIGQATVALANERYRNEIESVAALVRDPRRPRRERMPPLVTTIDEFLSSEPGVVVEVAGHEALREYGPAVLAAGIDLYFIAVGALADEAFEKQFRAAAAASDGQARVVSGAIGALDAISAAAVGGLERVTHTTRKPATTLLSAEEAATLTEAREMFRGPAREGALIFPESVNVAAAVSLAGIGLDRTELCVLADPGIDRNRHEVEAVGEFGHLRFEIQNIPSQDNARSARLVAMSIVHQLLNRSAPVVIG